MCFFFRKTACLSARGIFIQRRLCHIVLRKNLVGDDAHIVPRKSRKTQIQHSRAGACPRRNRFTVSPTPSVKTCGFATSLNEGGKVGAIHESPFVIAIITLCQNNYITAKIIVEYVHWKIYIRNDIIKVKNNQANQQIDGCKLLYYTKNIVNHRTARNRLKCHFFSCF